MSEHSRIVLKPKREAAVLRRHPWIFSGAVARVEGDPEPGAMVGVYDHRGTFLAWGHYSPASQIRVRIFSWDETARADSREFWEERLRRALVAREPIVADGNTTACRLVFAESDGVPGLVADRYADTLVVQFLTAGAAQRRELFADVLWDLLKPRTIYERSDVDVREKEDLLPHVGLLRGEEPSEQIEVYENGLHFLVDVRTGHKSGFYLDQRENRQLLRDIVARRVHTGKMPHVLNVFSYTGAFAVYALAGGAASVVNVDSSSEALSQGRENLVLNGFGRTRGEDIEGDAFDVLRAMRTEGRQFDVVVLDPPKFAYTQRDVKRAARGYKDINMQAFHLLRPGGLLFTFSCSGAVSADLFQKIVFGAALDAERQAQIIDVMMQSGDHPVALTFPESAYLKGLVCRIVR